MKLKNVSFIEQHFEKLWVAASVVVLLLVGWIFLMGDPNATTIDGQTMSPAKIDPHIVAKAQRLQEAANSDEVPEWATQKMVPYARRFEERAVAPVLRVEKFTVPAGQLAYFGEGGVIRPDEKPYIEPSFPAPTMFAWAARIGSISPEEVEANPELGDLFPVSAREAKAFDTPYVSIVGRWDTAKVLEELTRRDENAKRRSIPDERVKGFAVMDVEVQRQEARPDGTFAEPGDRDYEQFAPVSLPVEPPLVLRDSVNQGGAVAFNPRVVPAVMDPEKQGEDANEQAMGYAALLQGDNQWLIIQPPFPQMLLDDWEEPMSPEAILEQKQNLTRKEEIESIFADWQKKIDALNAKIQKTQNRAQLAPAAAAAPASGGPGARQPARATPAPAPTGGNRTVARAQEQIDRIVNSDKVLELQKEYQEITKGQTISLQSSGGLGRAGSYDAGMMMGPGGGPTTRGRATAPQRFPGTPQPGGRGAPIGADFDFAGGPGMSRGMQLVQAAGIQGGVLTHPELTIYSHDMTVEPGKSYRYRLRLRVINPLYNIPDMPPEQKPKHQYLFLVETDWTGWTVDAKGRGIEVPRLRHYFVQSISPSPAPGRANIEVWRYYKGLWRTEEFSAVRPGSPVGQSKEIKVYDPLLQRNRGEEVDFFAGAFLLDIVDGKGLKNTGRKPEAKARFLVDERQIAERSPSADKQNVLRERLQQDKQRMEEVAGLNGGPVARVP